jgi:hypothetical protein
MQANCPKVGVAGSISGFSPLVFTWYAPVTVGSETILLDYPQRVSFLGFPAPARELLVDIWIIHAIHGTYIIIIFFFSYIYFM